MRPKPRQIPIPLSRPSRKSLLAGTALASTLLIGMLAAPAPAEAAATCTIGGVPVALPPPTTPIVVGALGGDLVCVNGDTRIDGTAIDLAAAYGFDIYLNNSGTLIAGNVGIRTTTLDPGSATTIINRGDIRVFSNINNATGIFADADGANSRIDITNSGDIWATSTQSDARAIYGQTIGTNSPLSIVNSGNLTVNAFDLAFGIEGDTGGDSSDLTITNHGAIMATGLAPTGISGSTYGDNSAVTIMNWGPIWATGIEAFGITAYLSRRQPDHHPKRRTDLGERRHRGGRHRY